MAFQVVSLITALLVTSAWGQFPMLGGFPGMNPFMSGYNKQHNKPQVDPNMLTCINADSQDPQSQIRLTLRPLNRGLGGLHPGMGLGLGPLGPGSNMNDDREQSWSVEGILLPSQLVQKAGSYKVAVFSGGRTFGQCKMSALGRVMDSSRGHPLLNAMRMGPFSPLGMPGLHPFGGGMFGQFQQGPNGVASNNALVSTGTTMYSGIIHGMSFNQLVGRSMAVCQSLQGDQCYGLIPYCCTITRDALPASEVYVEPTVPGVGVGAQGPLGFNQVGLIGGAQAGIPGNTLPLANTGAAVLAVGVGGDNGLF